MAWKIKSSCLCKQKENRKTYGKHQYCVGIYRIIIVISSIFLCSWTLKRNNVNLEHSFFECKVLKFQFMPLHILSIPSRTFYNNEFCPIINICVRLITFNFSNYQNLALKGTRKRNNVNLEHSLANAKY